MQGLESSELIRQILLLLGALLVLTAVSSRVQVSLFALCMVALISPIEATYMWLYRAPWDVNVLSIVLESDSQEVAEYMAGIWLPLITSGLAFGGILIMLFRLRALRGIKWQHRSRFYVLGIGLLLSLLPWFLLSNPSAQANSSPDLEARLTGDGVELWMEPYAESFPFGVVVRIYAYCKQNAAIKDAVRDRATFSYGAKHVAPPSASAEVYVLVIGESSRPDRWELAGYGRETNPYLRRRDGLVFFTDMISPYSATRKAVPRLLTRKPLSEHKSILSAFKEAGFDTAFISTQGRVGVHDNTIASYALEADKVFFVNPAHYSAQGVYDEVVISHLRAVLQAAGNKFIIVHTLGSHFNYAHRYPASFDRFRPSIAKSDRVSLYDLSRRQEISNSYDNSILYTDTVLDRLLGEVQESSAGAVVLYVSDHGENLFDGNCIDSGHGRGNEYDFRIASLLWATSAWRERHVDTWLRLRQRAAAPLYSPQVFNTLLDLADIETAYSTRRESFAHVAWQPPRRELESGVDFDLAERHGVCRTLRQ